ncbi:MAG TPA: Hsp20/alpha crystallin family protein [Candidatus Binataceae bacterium]|nr:Hsp20/alpha crystallin family protein [Candidatus Binataceae bacterium]
MARAIQGWSPFRELDRFRRDFDDVFNRFFGSAGAPAAEFIGAPAIESFVENDKMVIRADLPGIDPKDVEVSVTGNTLTLRGSRESRQEDKERDFLHREISYGSFERSLTLPNGIKTEDIKANYHNGVLELTVPMPKELTSRKVPIQVGEASRPSLEKK